MTECKFQPFGRDCKRPATVEAHIGFGIVVPTCDKCAHDWRPEVKLVPLRQAEPAVA